MMYTIGQVSQMFDIPISTLRYYDKEGLFPDIQRTSGIRRFGERVCAVTANVEPAINAVPRIPTVIARIEGAEVFLFSRYWISAMHAS